MKNRLIYFVLLAALASILFSACTSVESKATEEVFLGNGANDEEDEVFISNSDSKESNQQINTAKEAEQLGTRTLPDRSSVETMIDGFGNKTETRNFAGHPRIRLLILRTSFDGKKEVTVYGQNEEVKIVPELAENALTATGDEVAAAAKIVGTANSGGVHNFMKKRKNAPQPVLQPLPSSAFQRPLPQTVQPVEPSEAQPESKNESVQTPQTKIDEDMME